MCEEISQVKRVQRGTRHQPTGELSKALIRETEALKQKARGRDKRAKASSHTCLYSLESQELPGLREITIDDPSCLQHQGRKFSADHPATQVLPQPEEQ